MNLLPMLAAGGGGGVAPTYVDDVFNTTTYTGTGVALTITTGINLIPVADPDWDNVKVLLSFDGSATNKATGTISQANLSGGTNISKFGGSKHVSRGTSGATDNIYSFATNFTNFNTSWCFEGWARATSSGVAGGGTAVIVNTDDSLLEGTNYITLSMDADSGVGTANVAVISSSATILSSSYACSMDFHFLSVCYDGTNLRWYVDGVLINTVAFAGFGTQPSYVIGTGVLAFSDGNESGSAQLDEIRWTQGSARLSSRTTVPTAPFPTGSVAGAHGLIWIKNRLDTSAHSLTDTVRFALSNKLYEQLETNTTNGAGSGAPVSVISSNGFTLDANSSKNVNTNSYVAWTFRQAPKFFDVVTYNGTGVAGRTVAHSLGQAPGMIIIKRVETGGAWSVYHRSFANTEYAVLNTTAAKVTGATTYWNSTTADASTFALGTATDVNTNTGTYVAYLFAHDTSTDGLIQCGSFTTDGSGNATVTLGWEPQFILAKVTNNASYGDWCIYDCSRGMPVTPGIASRLRANMSVSEDQSSRFEPTPTGFNAAFYSSANCIYLAIRRPNKPPTVGTQVYNAIARTGTGAAATVTGVGFAPDVVMSADRPVTYNSGKWFYDRLRGALVGISSTLTNAESSNPGSVTSFNMDGFSTTTSSTTNTNTGSYINHCFKRAPGVFDVVCYTGTGVAKNESHSLGVVPELMIVKTRSSAQGWFVLAEFTPTTHSFLYLDTTATRNNNTYANLNLVTAQPTAASFALSGSSANTTSTTYVAYLFATKAGISKVGSYTGNGSSLTVNCGFTTGARFILIKRTDSTGDWYVWDTVRGVIAGNDPHLSLNTTAAEVTTNDTIDPDTSGFIVNQVAATNVNVNAATYIYLAFA